MPRKLLAWTTLAPLTLCLFCLDLATCSARPPGLGFLHPLQTDIAWSPIPADASASSACQHTYVICVNGADPMNLGNFYCLSEFVRTHGFPHTYVGSMGSGSQFHHKIKEIRACDPAARIVLIGFSGGTYVVRRVANDLGCEGIEVDCLIYLGGDMIRNTPYSQPHNAKRILNITGHGFCLTGGNLFWNGADLDCAVNVRVPARHFLLPSRRETIQALMDELSAVAEEEAAPD